MGGSDTVCTFRDTHGIRAAKSRGRLAAFRSHRRSPHSRGGTQTAVNLPDTEVATSLGPYSRSYRPAPFRCPRDAGRLRCRVWHPGCFPQYRLATKMVNPPWRRLGRVPVGPRGSSSRSPRSKLLKRQTTTPGVRRGSDTAAAGCRRGVERTGPVVRGRLPEFHQEDFPMKTDAQLQKDVMDEIK